MESITRNVGDISSDELRLYETVLGEKLKENQQVIIQVISLSDQQPALEAPPEKQGDQAAASFPDWCNIYEGLSDEETSDIETVVLDRSGWTRAPQ